MMKTTVFFAPLWAAAALLSQSAAAVDWQNVPGQRITLFYPGQASWEWLLTDHEGSADIRSGQFCRHCHNGMQAEMGQKLVSGALMEPEPIAGKPGSVEAEIKTAHDRDKFYLRLSWSAVPFGGDKSYPEFEAMTSLMLDDGTVPEIARGGCFGACHADLDGMADSDGANNVDKYLVKSRSKMTRHGGGDHIKPQAELDGLLASGFFSEIWQARLNRGQDAEVTSGYILETRHLHARSGVAAKAEFRDGIWAVEFSRSLTSNGPDFKSLEAGKTYTLGFAIHDAYVRGRRHYVSLGYTLRLDDGPADFIARSQ